MVESIGDTLWQCFVRVAVGVLVETTGKKRDRSYVYQGYLDRLRVGTELDGRDGLSGRKVGRWR